MRKGFTLIEILISGVLSAVLLSSVFLSAYSLIRAWKAIERSADSLDGARVSISRIVSDTRNSGGIRPSSSASTLILDISGDIVSYDLNEGKVRRKVNSTSTYLTESGRVASLSFAYPSPKLVAITIQAECGMGSKILSAEAFVRN